MATKKTAVKKKSDPKKAVAAKKVPFKNYTTQLQARSKAPAFKGVDQDGKKISLSDYEGKKLVLYFYPQDDTPTCTVQACNLRDHYKSLQQKGIEIIGVSGDEIAKHKKFEGKYQLPFRLIADEEHVVIDLYDVWGKKQFMGKIYDGLARTTFLINEKGMIDHIINKPTTKTHAQEIIELWNVQ